MVRKKAGDGSFSVAGRRIGPGAPIFVIAEIGINHNQDLDLARALIDSAAAAGCDAAKFQTFTADALYIDRAKAGSYSLMGKKIPIYDLHVGLEMPDSWIPELMRHCKKRGVLFFSTPVDARSADRLDREGVGLYKVSSYDMTNIPLVRHLAKKHKPVIFSTGAAALGEVEETAGIFEAAGTPYAILHCVAKYPAPFANANLGVVGTLRSAFGVPTGFSDNGFVDANGRIDASAVPSAAAAVGSDLFEVHITLDRKLPGPDHGFATEPDELKSMVALMRRVRKEYNAGRRPVVPPLLLGSSRRIAYEHERYVRDFAFKCLFALREIPAGRRITARDVGVLRPGQYKRGLDPRWYELVVGKAVARRRIPRWEPITWDRIL